jgi:hypothetical protein
MTLAQVRALECNGCGDCCDSRRTDGFWTWGRLPDDQFREFNDGNPLLIPLERVEGGWRDRPHDPQDAIELTPTRFRCAAFRPTEDGNGLCGIHDAPRPSKCGEFPVHGPDLEPELEEHGEVWLQTGSLPRCTWYNICVVPEGDSRLEATAPSDGESPSDVA